MLRSTGIFGKIGIGVYICSMTFKELALELQTQGWRAYKVDDVAGLVRGNNLQGLAIRNLIEVQVYEGKSLVFVRNLKPKDK